jgi:hypothetical protein
MDRAMLVRHLAMAERHVADGREHVTRQQGIVSGLEAAGLGGSHTADVARQLLHSMLKGQALFIGDRNRLRDWLTQ